MISSSSTRSSAVLLRASGRSARAARPGRFREGVVGGVADQEVAEAEAVLAGELWPVGADQFAPHERCEARRHLRLLRGQRLYGAAVEDLAFDRAALEHPSLGRVELVEPRRQQRLQRRRHLDLASHLLGHREHLTNEERVAGGGGRDPRTQLLRHVCPDQIGRVGAVERLEPGRDRPGGAAVEQLRPGHTEQQQRGTAREQSARARSGRGRSARPTGCRRTTTTSGACSSSSLRNAQPISSADVPPSLSPSSERSAAAAAGSVGNTSSCLITSTTGQ